MGKVCGWDLRQALKTWRQTAAVTVTGDLKDQRQEGGRLNVDEKRKVRMHSTGYDLYLPPGRYLRRPAAKYVQAPSDSCLCRSPPTKAYL